MPFFMPDKGHAQSEETKKKISEALKKDGAEIVTRSPEAQKLFKTYTDSRSRSLEMKAQIESLISANQKLGRKKGTKGQRSKNNKQIEALRKKMKQEAENRREIVENAKAEKRLKQAKLVIEKTKLRTSKLEKIKQSINERLAKAKTPEAKQRIKDSLSRVDEMFKRQDEVKNKADEIISKKGKSDNVSKGSFDFSENTGEPEFVALGERKYKPWRALTLQEERMDPEKVNSDMNDMETELELLLIALTVLQIESIVKKLGRAIETKDIPLIESTFFGGYQDYKNALNNTAKKAYEIGKTGAAKESGVPVPATQRINNQIRSAESDQIAEVFVQEMENEGKSLARNAIATGATANVAKAALFATLTRAAGKMISNASGIVPAQFVNRGRKQVFYENITKITHFQRSEVLDVKTCNMCLSLDKRIVKADDPFAQLEIVHSFCRGTWVPIFAEEKPPEQSSTGIPKNIRDSFNSVDGRPLANDFKQIKRPLNTKENPEAQKEIEKRLKKQ